MAKSKQSKMITELKPTNLIAVEVAPDASNFEILNSENYLDKNNLPKGAKGDLCYLTEQNVWHIGNVILPDGKFKILGTVTKDKIGFDFEPYVGKELKSVGYVWMDYTLYDFEDTDKGNVVVYEEKRPYKFDEAEDSFYSLLVANGLYFENPMDAWYTYTTEEDCDKWQQIEDNLIKGKILILEKL